MIKGRKLDYISPSAKFRSQNWFLGLFHAHRFELVFVLDLNQNVIYCRPNVRPQRHAAHVDEQLCCLCDRSFISIKTGPGRNCMFMNCARRRSKKTFLGSRA